ITMPWDSIEEIPVGELKDQRTKNSPEDRRFCLRFNRGNPSKGIEETILSYHYWWGEIPLGESEGTAVKRAHFYQQTFLWDETPLYLGVI
ncbi:hypothetical protein KEJ44_09205, partial [Candidatus Bathyarchaeota archaeon]|nr:hypothetical protein [Candidatus Bathyarchaeota archaeon]